MSQSSFGTVVVASGEPSQRISLAMYASTSEIANLHHLVTPLPSQLGQIQTGPSVGAEIYRGGNKGLFVLLSRTQAGPGRTVKQEQEEISRNHVQTFISPSVV